MKVNVREANKGMRKGLQMWYGESGRTLERGKVDAVDERMYGVSRRRSRSV